MGQIQFRCPIICLFLTFITDILRTILGELRIGKRNLMLGCRMLELDGQTPTSGRFCRVPACPSKTKNFSI